MERFRKTLSLLLVMAICALAAGGAALAQTVTDTFYDYSPDSSDPENLHTVFEETWMYNIDASGQRTSGRPVGTETYEEPHEFDENDVCTKCGYEDTTLRIITQPVDTVIAVDVGGELTVVAKALDLTYQWQYRQGSGWVNPTNSQTAITPTLGVYGVFGNNGKQFRCVITDGDNNSVISDIVTVTVVHAIGHTLSMVQAVEPTCEQPGNSAYWRCDKCDKLFRDSQGQYEISFSSVRRPARGHRTGRVEAVEATCEETGILEHWRCYACGKLFRDSAANTEITEADTIAPAKGHALVKVEAVTPACETPGNIGYWECSACGKLFGDEAAQNEITEADTVVPATGHALAKVEAVEPTCEAAGNIEYWQCSDCGKLFGDDAAQTEISEADTVVSAKGHALTKVEAVAATCEVPGSIEYWQCSDCGKLFAEEAAQNEITEADTVVPAKGHALTRFQAVEPTCEAPGSIEYWQCSDCGKLFADGECETEITEADTVVPAKGHTIVKVDAVEPTYAATGNTEHWKCSDCGKLFSDETGLTEIAEADVLLDRLPMEILSQPASATVVAGETASFAVKVGGHGVSYRWQYWNSGSAKWEYTSLSGASSDTLSFEAKSGFDGRQFQCEIKDAFGATLHSDAVTLTVLTPAKITKDPASLSVPANGTATFTVAVSGSVTKYQWQYLPVGGDWADTGLSGASSEKLSFSAPVAFSGRQFRCAVTDALGNTVYSNAATLLVGTAVKITGQPSAAAVAPNDTATFTVSTTGTVAKYQWQYSQNGTDWVNTGLNGASTAKLSFSAPSGFNGRQFRCVITDTLGNTVTSGAAKLTVGIAAKITGQPANVAVAANGTATFTVTASGTVTKYQWQYRAGSSGDWTNTSLNGANTAKLSFTAPAAFSGRQFRCVVTDILGKTVTSNAATLTVGTAAKITVQPVSVTVAANGTATFTVTASGTVTKYQWQYRTGSSGTWANTGLNGASTARLSFTAPSGFSGRQFRCVISDSLGNTITTNAATLTVK